MNDEFREIGGEHAANHGHCFFAIGGAHNVALLKDERACVVDVFHGELQSPKGLALEIAATEVVRRHAGNKAEGGRIRIRIDGERVHALILFVIHHAAQAVLHCFDGHALALNMVGGFGANLGGIQNREQ